MKKTRRKAKDCNLEIHESLQQGNNSNEKTLTIAEKKFQKQIADVPLFDCIACEQTLFRKDVTPIRQEYQETELRRRKRKRSTKMPMNLQSHIYICKGCKKTLKNDVDSGFAIDKKFR